VSSDPQWSEPGYVLGAVLAQLEDLEPAERLSVLREAVAEEEKIAAAIKRGAIERRAFHDALDRYVSAANAVLDAWPDGDTTGYPKGLPSFDEHCSDLMGWKYEEQRATAEHEVSEETKSGRPFGEPFPCDRCGAPLDHGGKGWTVYGRDPRFSFGQSETVCSLCAGVDPETGNALDYRERLRLRGFVLGKVGGVCHAWIRPTVGGYVQVWSNTFRSDLAGEEVYQALFVDDVEAAAETVCYPDASEALRDLHRFAALEDPKS